MTHPRSGAGPSATPGTEYWLGQDDLPWNVLLSATLSVVPEAAVLRGRLAELSADHHWPQPPDDAVVEGEADSLLARFSALTDVSHPVSVGRTSAGLVIRAHHAHVDGLGLLAVLRALVGDEVVSRVAGIGDRPRRPTAGALATRLLEVAFHPPRRVAASPAAGSGRREHDVFAVTTVGHAVRTVDLAHAVVQAVAARNSEAGLRSDRIALAVGVSTVSGADLRVGDDSGFLRFTGAERLGVAELELALATAPLEVGGTARGGAARRSSRLIRWASRAFAARLGSTVLVSHLGRVDGAGLAGLAFYPLSGGGSGISAGAATVGGVTTVTLRARGRQHSAADLESLLSDLVARLG